MMLRTNPFQPNVATQAKQRVQFGTSTPLTIGELMELRNQLVQTLAPIELPSLNEVGLLGEHDSRFGIRLYHETEQQKDAAIQYLVGAREIVRHNEGAYSYKGAPVVFLTL